VGSLTEGKELEEAMLCVNGREFVSCLDWARDNLSTTMNAWKLITELAYQNPAKFVSFVKEVSNDLFKWGTIDEMLRTGPHRKIPAIKKYREKTGEGLKEAKKAIEERMDKLGMSYNNSLDK
jgi:hypothetical protein